MTFVSTAAWAALCLAAPAEPAQPKDARTVLLVESDQAHGAKAFKDTSRLAQPIARWGDTHHSTRQKKLGRSAICFDGRDDYLSVKDGPAFAFGVDDFAIEFWFLPEGAGRRFICGQAPANGADAQGSVGIAIEADGRIRAAARTARDTLILYAPPAAHADGKWHHVSFRRTGDVLLLLVDGIEHDRTRIGPKPIHDSVEPFSIGRSGRFASGHYRGYLDRFVVTRTPRQAAEF